MNEARQNPMLNAAMQQAVDRAAREGATMTVWKRSSVRHPGAVDWFVRNDVEGPVKGGEFVARVKPVEPERCPFCGNEIQEDPRRCDRCKEPL